jgi:type IV pilus assembly protein PilC
MAKSAGEFAAHKETFKLPNEGEAPKKTEKIVLNISDLEAEKRILTKGGLASKLKVTGNPIVDGFKQLNDYFISHSPVKTQDLANFFRLLSTMINAGLPVVRSLDSLAEQAEKTPKLKMIIEDTARRIEEGEKFSDALKSHSEVFSNAQIGMISAGEASGQLNEVLLDLATEVEKSASIQRKVKGALTYPVVIFTLMTAVIFLMMVKVIPKMTDLFSQSGAELPGLTRGLIAMSNFLTNNTILILLGILFTIGGFIFWKKTPRGRYDWDKIKLKLPIFGKIIKKSILARFCRLFGNLLGSGVSLVESLKILSKAVGNEVYKERILLAVEDIEQGIPLAENLTGSPLFPAMVINMVEVGEKTASLEQILEKLADFFEDEVDVAVKSLSKAFEPIILVVVGVVVGLLVAAIMLPIIQLSEIGVG